MSSVTSAKDTAPTPAFKVGRHTRLSLVKLKERSDRWYRGLDSRQDRVTIVHEGKAIGVLLTMDDYRELARRELGY